VTASISIQPDGAGSGGEWVVAAVLLGALMRESRAMLRVR
jgi:hypothetical protein